MFQLQDLTQKKRYTWPIKIIFGLLVVSFISFYGWSASNSTGGQSTAVARMRSESISPFHRWEEITPLQVEYAKRERLGEKLSALGSQASLLPYLQRSGVADKLVTADEAARQAANDVILTRRAERLNLVVTPADVVNVIIQQPGMTQEKIMQLTQQQGFENNVDMFIDYMHRQATASNAQNVIGLEAQASFYELWQEYLLANEKFTLEMANYPATNYNAKVAVTEAALQTYLDEHKPTYRKPDQHRYAYILGTLKEIQEGIATPREELQAFYNKDPKRFEEKAGTKSDQLYISLSGDVSTTVALTRIEQLRAKALTTKDWTDLQSAVNETDPVKIYARTTDWETTAALGHSGNYFNALATLPLDTVSTPVLDQGAVYLLRVKDRRNDRVPPFETVVAQVTEQYRSEKGTEKFNSEFDRLSKEIKPYQDAPSTDSLHKFAQAVKYKDALTTWTTRNAALIPGIGSLGEDAEYINGLERGHLSDVIKSADQFYVLQLIDEKEAYDPPLTEVRLQVEQAFRKGEAAKLAEAAANQSLKIAQGGADFKTAVADAPTSITITDPFKRGDAVNVLASRLIDFGPQTRSIATGTVGVNAYGPSKEEAQGYVVWRVQNIEAPTIAEFSADRNQFAAQYLQLQRTTLIKEWLRDQRRENEFKLTTAAK